MAHGGRFCVFSFVVLFFSRDAKMEIVGEDFFRQKEMMNK